MNLQPRMLIQRLHGPDGSVDGISCDLVECTKAKAIAKWLTKRKLRVPKAATARAQQRDASADQQQGLAPSMGIKMPLIVFTHTANAMPKQKIVKVAKQIRESMLRNYVIKAVPDALRAHTRVKIIEIDRECYIGTDNFRPIYDVELIGPVDSVVGKDAEAFAKEVTNAILTAEGSPCDEENAQRVWCVFTDIPDMKWAIGPKILSRRSTLKHVLRYHAKSAARHQQAAE